MVKISLFCSISFTAITTHQIHRHGESPDSPPSSTTRLGQPPSTLSCAMMVIA
ncbi:hypothetical protein A2U01_0003616 [Trifolium medium]|uniref:Uncharacterized protein n=1 Tax=Trifolium medium TaxID=97028 RepID=A0A392M9D5_9FABA|nr:hypothetical protein [Trifolium medium]